MAGVRAVTRAQLIVRASGMLMRSVAGSWGLRAELLVAAAFLTGWLLVTIGIASYTSAKVWPISFGLLLLSLCGWKWVWNLTSVGLYTLIGDDEESP